MTKQEQIKKHPHINTETHDINPLQSKFPTRHKFIEKFSVRLHIILRGRGLQPNCIIWHSVTVQISFVILCFNNRI